MTDRVARLTAALEGRYHIDRELGEGGMATVYLAEDLKHHRRVAVKVLRPELAAVIGAERFLKEIEVTAGLQHPNILPLYDSGEADSLLYYVMPFVEGQSLREMLDREKQLPIETALDIAIAVAAALDYAHRQGVVHRDIKPANVLLHDGQALVADFGIALAVSQAGAERLTETGLSLGTPFYMSPEQATGDRELDARSDLYSLGAMTYEMLTGDPPHTGSTAQAVIAALITEEPRPIALRRPKVPPHVAAAVHKALSRLPADRFRSAAKFSEALADPAVMDTVVAATTAAIAPPRARSDWRLPVAIAAAVAFAGIAILQTVRASGGAAQLPVDRFTISLPVPLVSARPGGNELSVSPDGRLIVFAARDTTGSRLYVRRLGELKVEAIPGTEGAAQPFFSPDGKWIGFVVDQSILRKVPVGGGPAVDVWRQPETGMKAPDWGDDGNILFTQIGSLLRISSEGGTLDTLMTARQGVVDWPQVLPGSRSALVSIRETPQTSQVALLDLGTGKLSTLVPGGTQALYLPSGYLLYGNAQSRSLFAVPFDAPAGTLTGEPVAVLENVAFQEAAARNGGMQLAISGDGTLVYVGGQTRDVGGNEMVLTDLRGREDTLSLGLSFDTFRHPRFAPVGHRLVFDAGSDIYVYDPDVAASSRLTFEGQNFFPAWSPDGKEIAFSSQRPGSQRTDVYRRRSDGRGSAEPMLSRPLVQGPRVWMKDGRLLVVQVGAETGYDLAIFDTTGTLLPYLDNPWNESAPVLSPDSRWVAYVSNESGSDEVYVSAFPEAGGRWKVSEGGGSDPYWDEDGTIYYLHDADLWAARMRTSPSVVVQDRRRVLAGPFESGQRGTNIDREPHGGRFVLVRAGVDDTPTQLTVVTNWLDELRESLSR